MGGRFGSRERAGSGAGGDAAPEEAGVVDSGADDSAENRSGTPIARATGTPPPPPPPPAPGSGRVPPPPPPSAVPVRVPDAGTDAAPVAVPSTRSPRAKRAKQPEQARTSRASKAPKAPKPPKQTKVPKPPKAAREPRPPFRVRSRAFWRRQRGPQAQWRLLLRAAHPKQALALAVAIVVLAAYSDRGLGPSLVAGAAVLLVQLATGLLNDLVDAPLDRRAERLRKPVATGELPPGNVSFVAVVLVLIALPVSLQNGTLAGLALLATLPVAFVHDRILHRTPASFLGWMVTFALLPVFLAYGGWGGGRHGADPTWQFVLVSAFVGLCVHLATALPDLVGDNKAGVRSLPLVIALRIGAPRLLLGTVALSAVVLVAFVVVGLDPGLRVPF